jgi:tetratricopeptide (TPR) repeat protein
MQASTVVVCGPGGMVRVRPRPAPSVRTRSRVRGGADQGKTQLVLNYLDRHCDPYDLALWIGADTLQESCLSALAALGKQADTARAVGELGALLRSFGGSKLVVLDNADTVKWTELLPLAQDGHVVVTTRNRELLENATRNGVLELSTFTEAEALELLSGGAHTPAPGAVELVQLLGCLPLAVEHVRASMLQQGLNAASMLETLRAVEASGGSAARSELERAYSPAVLAAFDLSVANAAAACAAGGVDGSVGRRTALMCSYLHAECIPRWFVEAWLARVHGMHGERAALVVEQLVQFSILTVREGAAGGDVVVEQYDMHRILQASLRTRDVDLRVLSSLLACLTWDFDFDRNATDHSHAEQLAVHTDSCVTHGRAVLARLPRDTQLHLSHVLVVFRRWLAFKGLYAKVGAVSLSAVAIPPSTHSMREQSVEVAEACVHIRQRLVEPTDELLLNALFELAQSCSASGDYPKALKLREEVLAARRRTLGPDHMDVAVTAHDLAVTLASMGRYAKALELYEDALRITRVEIDPDHPHVATMLKNIGGVHSSLGNYTKALGYYEDALRIIRKTLGPNHPSLAIILSSIGGAHSDMGNYSKALECYEEDLRISRKALGPDHPDVAATLNSIGEVHRYMGKFARALEYYTDALHFSRKALGPDHPSVATPLNNIALAHCSMGNYGKALEYLEDALRISRKTLGPDHPDVATVLCNMGATHRDMGSFAMARELSQSALQSYRAALGPDHDNTGVCMYQLGGTLLEMGDVLSALPTLRDGYNVVLRALGAEHQHTKRARAWLLRAEGAVLLTEGRANDAAVKLEEALGLFSADVRHGPDHVRTKAVAAELQRARSPV